MLPSMLSWWFTCSLLLRDNIHITGISDSDMLLRRKNRSIWHEQNVGVKVRASALVCCRLRQNVCICKWRYSCFKHHSAIQPEKPRHQLEAQTRTHTHATTKNQMKAGKPERQATDAFNRWPRMAIPNKQKTLLLYRHKAWCVINVTTLSIWCSITVWRL